MSKIGVRTSRSTACITAKSTSYTVKALSSYSTLLDVVMVVPLAISELLRTTYPILTIRWSCASCVWSNTFVTVLNDASRDRLSGCVIVGLISDVPLSWLPTDTTVMLMVSTSTSSRPLVLGSTNSTARSVVPSGRYTFVVNSTYSPINTTSLPGSARFWYVLSNVNIGVFLVVSFASALWFLLFCRLF